MGTIDAPHAALYGALIGFLGGCAAQLIAQGATFWRVWQDRLRRERRVLEAIRGLLISYRNVIGAMTQPDQILRSEMFEDVLTPLRTAVREQSVYLDLTPTQIEAIFQTVAVGDSTLRWLVKATQDDQQPGVDRRRHFLGIAFSNANASAVVLGSESVTIGEMEEHYQAQYGK